MSPSKFSAPATDCEEEQTQHCSHSWEGDCEIIPFYTLAHITWIQIRVQETCGSLASPTSDAMQNKHHRRKNKTFTACVLKMAPFFSLSEFRTVWGGLQVKEMWSCSKYKKAVLSTIHINVNVCDNVLETSPLRAAHNCFHEQKHAVVQLCSCDVLH